MRLNSKSLKLLRSYLLLLLAFFTLMILCSMPKAEAQTTDSTSDAVATVVPAVSLSNFNYLDSKYLDELEKSGQWLNVIVHGWPNYDPEMLKKLTGFQHYQKRDLYHVLLMAQRPHLKVNLVYLTSDPLSGPYIDYLLKIPGKVESAADIAQLRAKIHPVVFAGGDPYAPLAQKILAPENAAQLSYLQEKLAHIEEETGTPFMGMSIFATNEYEEKLAKTLGVPLLGANPQHAFYGRKDGSRFIFEEAGVDFPGGIKSVTSLEELSSQLSTYLLENLAKGRKVQQMIIKLNEGISGKGNWMLTVGDLLTAEKTVSQLTAEIVQRLTSGPEAVSADYLKSMQVMGAIAEEFIEGEAPTFPSVQMIIDPVKGPFRISTHEQVLGGPSGQVYLGCIYPANPLYVDIITDITEKIAQQLHAHQVTGHFGVDYIVVAQKDSAGKVISYKAKPLEVNLRHLGTTHPFAMARLVTNDEVVAYVASDNKKITDPAHVGLPGNLLVQLLQKQPHLHFNPARGEGVVVHLTDALEKHNKIGVTCIAKTAGQAEKICQEFQLFLDETAKLYSEL